MYAARLAARDAHVRESWVRSMEARIVRDMLQECHRVEGVNHYEKCQELADRYTSMLADSRVCIQDFTYQPCFVETEFR